MTRALTLLLATAAASAVMATLRAPVAAAAWEPAQTVARGDVRDVALAADARGGAVVVWRAEGRVRARARTPGGRLGMVATLSRSGRSAGTPAVAVDARGDAVAAWSESVRGRHQSVWAAVRRRGGRWGVAELVGRSGKRSPDPAVAMAARGESVVVWRYDARLQASFRAWERSFGRARFVLPAGAHHFVAYDRGGRAWLAFASLRGGPPRVATSAAGALRLGRPRPVGSAPASFPALATTSTSELAVAYRSSAVPGVEDLPGPIAVVRRDRAGWERAQVVSAPAFAPPGAAPLTLATRPAIAATRDATFVAAWLQTVWSGSGGEREEVAAAVRVGGERGFAPAIRVGSAGQFSYPAVAADDGGRVAIVWRGADGSVLASVRPHGGVFAAPVRLSSAPSGFLPRVAGGRTLVAAWEHDGRAVLRAWH